MEPKFVEKDAFNVMGFSLRGNPMTMNHKGAWDEFMKYYDKVMEFSIERGYYGVYFGVEGEEGVVELIAGMAVDNVDEVPQGLAMREVSKASYAVFECNMNTLGQTWGYIYGEWLPKSQQYENAEDATHACFELYPPDFSSESSSLFIYTPIRAK